MRNETHQLWISHLWEGMWKEEVPIARQAGCVLLVWPIVRARAIIAVFGPLHPNDQLFAVLIIGWMRHAVCATTADLSMRDLTIEN